MTRVLHVLGGMGRGGVETWLAAVACRIDRGRFALDIATTNPGPHALADVVGAAGVRIDDLAPLRSPLRLARALRRLLAAREPYDVIHCHFLGYAGWVLRIARAAGVPIRIAHAHTTRGGDAPRPGLGSFTRRGGRLWIQRHATRGLAVSAAAAAHLYGDDWNQDARFEVLRYGLDYAAFMALPAPAVSRAALGIPAARQVIGHVGRMVPVKNHEFLIEVFDGLVRGGSDVHLLLVGDGPERVAIERSVRARGLADRATLTGERADIAGLLAAVDLMVFPSHYEGTPLALLEAQAAGVPILASAAVSPELGVVSGMLERMSPATTAATWASHAARRLDGGRYDSRATSRVLAASEYGIEPCLARLTAIYEGR